MLFCLPILPLAWGFCWDLRCSEMLQDADGEASCDESYCRTHLSRVFRHFQTWILKSCGKPWPSFPSSSVVFSVSQVKCHSEDGNGTISSEELYQFLIGSTPVRALSFPLCPDWLMGPQRLKDPGDSMRFHGQAKSTLRSRRLVPLCKIDASCCAASRALITKVYTNRLLFFSCWMILCSPLWFWNMFWKVVREILNETAGFQETFQHLPLLVGLCASEYAYSRKMGLKDRINQDVIFSEGGMNWSPFELKNDSD